MQKAKFLLVTFATAAAISITLGAGRHVDLNDKSNKYGFLTLLGVQTVLLLFLFLSLQNIYLHGIILETEVLHQ